MTQKDVAAQALPSAPLAFTFGEPEAVLDRREVLD